jgi:hypothetical protein
MPAGWGEEERFAAEVEYGPGAGDDGAEDLARELELVALLRSAGPALSPATAARSRAKERLMAAFAAQNCATQHGATNVDDTGPVAVIAPVALAAPPEEHHAEPARPRHGGRHAAPDAPTEAQVPADDLGARRLRRSRPQRGGHRRPALLGAAAAAALVALAGTGTFASQDALPGDPMYGVKRVAESTGYALTFGEQAKARRHLEQAQRRLDEVEGLVTREPATAAPADPAEQALVRSTMQEFDTDANEGSRLLLAGPEGAEQVDDVRQWAEEQSARLSGLRATMPAQDKADESLALLDRLLDETAAAQPPCDPALGPCPTAVEGDPADATTETAVVPDGVAPGGAAPRTTARVDDDEGAADDTATTDDEQSSSDDGSDDRAGSGGSGDAGDGDAAGSDGSDGGVSVPLPLPAPVRVPSVVPGVPGISLG